jgi:hypothetical protein
MFDPFGVGYSYPTHDPKGSNMSNPGREPGALQPDELTKPTAATTWQLRTVENVKIFEKPVNQRLKPVAQIVLHVPLTSLPGRDLKRNRMGRD